MEYTMMIAGEAVALKYTFNSLCAMEALAGGTLENALKKPFTAARLLLWGGIQEKKISLKGVGELLEKHLQSGGTLEEILEGCLCAMTRSGFLDSGEA